MADAVASTLATVVIPAYNAAEFISDAIDSVLAQSHQHFEIIVVDDGSSDGTCRRVEAYKDSRVRLENLQENQGASAARNHGIRCARGSFIALLDADDLWHREFLRVMLGAMMASGASAAHSAARYIPFLHSSPKTMPWLIEAHNRINDLTPRTQVDVFQNPYFPTSAMVFRADIFTPNEVFDESLQTAEDTDFVFRLVELTVLWHTTVALAVIRERDASLRHKNCAYTDTLHVLDRFCNRNVEFVSVNRRVVNAMYEETYYFYLRQLLYSRQLRRAFSLLLKIPPRFQSLRIVLLGLKIPALILLR